MPLDPNAYPRVALGEGQEEGVQTKDATLFREFIAVGTGSLISPGVSGSSAGGQVVRN